MTGEAHSNNETSTAKGLPGSRRLYLEILVILLTGAALLGAANGVDFVSWLVIVVYGACALVYVISLFVLLRTDRIPKTTTPSTATVVALVPTVVFALTVWGFSAAFAWAHEDRRAGSGYADLTDFFATSAQIVVGLLIVIALEGRPADPTDARVLHRHGLIQVMLGGGAALLALALPDHLQVQAFASMVVTGSLAAGLVAVVLLAAFSVSASTQA